MSEGPTILDPTIRREEVRDFESGLRQRAVGQDRAVRQSARVYQVHQAGLSARGRPIVDLLLLGPTGSGKTRLVEAAEVLLGDSRAVVKVDCAEFQHSHEISKLIGSPPGYLGHRETRPAQMNDGCSGLIRRGRESQRFALAAIARQSGQGSGRVAWLTRCTGRHSDAGGLYGLGRKCRAEARRYALCRSV
jgi:hypothetical protein